MSVILFSLFDEQKSGNLEKYPANEIFPWNRQSHIHRIKLEHRLALTLKDFKTNFTSSEEAKLLQYGRISALPNEFRQLTYLICHVIYNNDAVGSAVVTGSDGAKPLLTCGVPLRDTLTETEMIAKDKRLIQ